MQDVLELLELWNSSRLGCGLWICCLRGQLLVAGDERVVIIRELEEIIARVRLWQHAEQGALVCLGGRGCDRDQLRAGRRQPLTPSNEVNQPSLGGWSPSIDDAPKRNHQRSARDELVGHSDPEGGAQRKVGGAADGLVLFVSGRAAAHATDDLAELQSADACRFEARARQGRLKALAERRQLPVSLLLLSVEQARGGGLDVSIPRGRCRLEAIELAQVRELKRGHSRDESQPLGGYRIKLREDLHRRRRRLTRVQGAKEERREPALMQRRAVAHTLTEHPARESE